MAVSNDQIIDLLYKQAFGVTKTDTETNKSPSNESIPSPLLNRGDTAWTQADQIPGTAAATAGIVQAYTGANAVECVADNTTVPIGSIYPTWKTNLTYWIPTEFGSTYQVQVWVDNSGVANPTVSGTQIFADGSGGTGQWYYNYQSGVLNFIGETIPAALTAGKVLYIVGYRYIGKTGVTNLPSNVTIGNLKFDNVTISTIVGNANIELAPNGTGVVNSSANIVAPYFQGNFSGNVTIAAANTQVVYSANGSAVGSNAFTFDYASNLLTVNGNSNVTGNISVGGILTNNYYYGNGAPVDFQQAAGSNNQIQYNANGDFGASANFAFDPSTNNLSLNGSLLLGGTGENQIVNNSNTQVEIRGGWNNSASTGVNIVAGDYANSNNWGKLSIQGNVSGNSVGFSEANAFIFTNPGSGLGNIVKVDILNTNASNTTTGVIQANGGIGVTGNGYFGGNLSVTGNIANANNVSVTNALEANTGNFSGNITSLNANLGNLAQANFVDVASNVRSNNITVNLSLTGNTANFSGNVVVPNLTVNLELAGNTANFTGNINSALNANLGNLVQANFVNVASNVTTSNLAVNLELAGNTANFSNSVRTPLVYNGNSNISITANANITVAAAGTNVITISGDSSNASNNEVVVIGNIKPNGIWTNNYYYGNGVPVDFQQPAGSNNQVQYNANGDFGASANFTFDPSTNNLSVTGNILANNITGTLLTNAQNNITSVGTLNGLVVAGNITPNANITYDLGNNTNRFKDIYLANSTIYLGNITLTAVSDDLTIGGNVNANNANLGNLVVANFANIASNIIANNANINLELSGNTANFAGNVRVNNLTVNLELAGNTANFTGNINSALNANLGNLVQANFVNVASNITTSNLTVNLELSGNTANFTGNINSALNANLGNLVTANFVNVASNVTTSNLTVNLELSGNTANFTGNINSALNANLGNLVTANFVNVSSNLNVTGNVNAGNLVGPLANGNSNIQIYSNANVEISVAGNANVATVTGTGLQVAGNIQATTGSMLANGNITANGFLVGANASVTGEANVGSLKTSNITATTADLSINAGANGTINLVPNGTGTVNVSNFRISQVADPTQPRDAATKEYVDSTAQGLTIHTAVAVTSVTNLNATYANGGSVLTTIAITGNKTIQFSAAHGLSVGDELAWDNSFNGITGNNAYFVYSTPAGDTITVKNGYFGPEVTTLTNGTGLTETARALTGVGATLTNAGANAAIQIDGITLSSNNRVLVQGQTNAFENGVYVVTTVGNGSAAWVLTRSSDTDTYSPTLTNALGYGDYFFVQQGSGYAGSSYVLTAPVGEIVFGYTNIAFSQFSAAGSYTAGNGIAITGTTISANTDGVTTDIVSGNIVVKASANLTTPNIGDATFQSITWSGNGNGNVTANNLSISNIANITGNLTVAGSIQANLQISSNANVSGLNLTTTGNVEAGANVLANNVNANTLVAVPTANVSNIVNAGNANITYELSGNTANFTGNINSALNANLGNLVQANFANIASNVVSNNLTVNLELAGNTANFTSNVRVNNLNVNLELSGNTANFTGNINSALNANLGNLVQANFVDVTSNIRSNNITVNLELAGNTANFTGNINSALNANLGNLVTANFANIASNIVSNNVVSNNVSVNLELSGNTANFSGNVLFARNLTANNLASNNIVSIGNSVIGWGNVTTTSITANQTIAEFPVANVTGIEFLVKGIDAAGAKYSIATVQTVTDGTSADYSIYGSAFLGSSPGTLAINISAGNVALQVTPSSSNSTIWITQYRTI